MDGIGQGLTEERERYVVLEKRRFYAGGAEEEDMADGRKETERVRGVAFWRALEARGERWIWKSWQIGQESSTWVNGILGSD